MTGWLRRMHPRCGANLALVCLILAGCGESSENGAQPPRQGAPATRSLDQVIQDAAADPTFDVGAMSATVLMAVELRVTATSVTPVGVSFVRAVLPTGHAEQDVRLMAMSDGRPLHSYAIADPLLMEEEITDGGPHRTVRLEEATTWVYVPVETQRLELTPASPAAFFQGGDVDLEPLVSSACGRFDNLRQCAATLAEESAGGSHGRPSI